MFNQHKGAYYDSLTQEERSQLVGVEAKHIDGTMGASQRDELLSWLKNTPKDSNECHILTNVKCLSEGVDVPSLDAVMFLSAKNSQVDVVQSVGRVMRTAPNKKYGYIIIPIVVPAGVKPEEALDDNERYKVVWTVLNALRAHDDRFNAEINKIDLNKKKNNKIIVGGIGSRATDSDGDTTTSATESTQLALPLPEIDQLQNAIYAKMVQKVGNKRYWVQWAQDVAQIAQRYIERINLLIDTDGKHKKAFDSLLKGLQKNTFQLGETDEADELFSDMLPQNSERVIEQKKAPVRIIIGNPPYSVGQKSANDNAQNQKYPKLDGRVGNTYVKYSLANNKNKIYDSYIKAFRWSSDRLDNQNGGIVAFITNNGWLESNGMDGFRQCLEQEFSSINIFNLRGAIRGKSKDATQKEGQNVFDIMTGVAITILVKKPNKNPDEKATIYYHDIGDYLKRTDKLEILKHFKGVNNSKIDWKVLKPNEHNDWLNQRSDLFSSFIQIEANKKYAPNEKSYFNAYSLGVSCIIASKLTL